jgi:hypothetical protein
MAPGDFSGSYFLGARAAPENYNYLCTTKVMSANHAHGEVYSIQFYVIKFVRDLQQVGGI